MQVSSPNNPNSFTFNSIDEFQNEITKFTNAYFLNVSDQSGKLVETNFVYAIFMHIASFFGYQSYSNSCLLEFKAIQLLQENREFISGCDVNAIRKFVMRMGLISVDVKDPQKTQDECDVYIQQIRKKSPSKNKTLIADASRLADRYFKNKSELAPFRKELMRTIEKINQKVNPSEPKPSSTLVSPPPTPFAVVKREPVKSQQKFDDKLSDTWSSDSEDEHLADGESNQQNSNGQAANSFANQSSSSLSAALEAAYEEFPSNEQVQNRDPVNVNQGISQETFSQFIELLTQNTILDVTSEDDKSLISSYFTSLTGKNQPQGVIDKWLFAKILGFASGETSLKNSVINSAKLINYVGASNAFVLLAYAYHLAYQSTANGTDEEITKAKQAVEIIRKELKKLMNENPQFITSDFSQLKFVYPSDDKLITELNLEIKRELRNKILVNVALGSLAALTVAAGCYYAFKKCFEEPIFSNDIQQNNSQVNFYPFFENNFSANLISSLSYKAYPKAEKSNFLLYKTGVSILTVFAGKTIWDKFFGKKEVEQEYNVAHDDNVHDLSIPPHHVPPVDNFQELVQNLPAKAARPTTPPPRILPVAPSRPRSKSTDYTATTVSDLVRQSMVQTAAHALKPQGEAYQFLGKPAGQRQSSLAVSPSPRDSLSESPQFVAQAGSSFYSLTMASDDTLSQQASPPRARNALNFSIDGNEEAKEQPLRTLEETLDGTFFRYRHVTKRTARINALTVSPIPLNPRCTPSILQDGPSYPSSPDNLRGSTVHSLSLFANGGISDAHLRTHYASSSESSSSDEEGELLSQVSALTQDEEFDGVIGVSPGYDAQQLGEEINLEGDRLNRSFIRIEKDLTALEGSQDQAIELLQKCHQRQKEIVQELIEINELKNNVVYTTEKRSKVLQNFKRKFENIRQAKDKLDIYLTDLKNQMAAKTDQPFFQMESSANAQTQPPIFAPAFSQVGQPAAASSTVVSSDAPPPPPLGNSYGITSVASTGVPTAPPMGVPLAPPMGDSLAPPMAPPMGGPLAPPMAPGFSANAASAAPKKEVAKPVEPDFYAIENFPIPELKDWQSLKMEGEEANEEEVHEYWFNLQTQFVEELVQRSSPNYFAISTNPKEEARLRDEKVKEKENLIEFEKLISLGESFSNDELIKMGRSGVEKTQKKLTSLMNALSQLEGLRKCDPLDVERKLREDYHTDELCMLLGLYQEKMTQLNASCIQDKESELKEVQEELTQYLEDESKLEENPKKLSEEALIAEKEKLTKAKTKAEAKLTTLTAEIEKLNVMSVQVTIDKPGKFGSEKVSISLDLKNLYLVASQRMEELKKIHADKKLREQHPKEAYIFNYFNKVSEAWNGFLSEQAWRALLFASALHLRMETAAEKNLSLKEIGPQDVVPKFTKKAPAKALPKGAAGGLTVNLADLTGTKLRASAVTPSRPALPPPPVVAMALRSAKAAPLSSALPLVQSGASAAILVPPPLKAKFKPLTQEQVETKLGVFIANYYSNEKAKYELKAKKEIKSYEDEQIEDEIKRLQEAKSNDKSIDADRYKECLALQQNISEIKAIRALFFDLINDTHTWEKNYEQLTPEKQKFWKELKRAAEDFAHQEFDNYVEVNHIEVERKLPNIAEALANVSMEGSEHSSGALLDHL